MGLQNLINHLREKPRHQRERIAAIATGASFFVILIIWMFSFSEMNRSFEKAREDSARENLKDLGSGISEGKKSIEEMMQQIPEMPAMGTGVESGSADGSENAETADPVQVESGSEENAQAQPSEEELKNFFEQVRKPSE